MTEVPRHMERLCHSGAASGGCRRCKDIYAARVVWQGEHRKTHPLNLCPVCGTVEVCGHESIEARPDTTSKEGE